MVKAKVKLRELGTRGLTSDVLIPEEDRLGWQEWLGAINQLNKFQVPRCLLVNEDGITQMELHTFTDASEEAFAAAV